MTKDLTRGQKRKECPRLVIPDAVAAHRQKCVLEGFHIKDEVAHVAQHDRNIVLLALLIQLLIQDVLGVLVAPEGFEPQLDQVRVLPLPVLGVHLKRHANHTTPIEKAGGKDTNKSTSLLVDDSKCP